MTCYKDEAARPDGLAGVIRAHMEMARKTSNFRRNLDIMTAGGPVLYARDRTVQPTRSMLTMICIISFFIWKF